MLSDLSFSFVRIFGFVSTRFPIQWLTENGICNSSFMRCTFFILCVLQNSRCTNSIYCCNLEEGMPSRTLMWKTNLGYVCLFGCEFWIVHPGETTYPVSG